MPQIFTACRRITSLKKQMINKQPPAGIQSRLLPWGRWFTRIPLWLLAIGICALIAFWKIVDNESNFAIFSALRQGVFTTLYVSFLAYFFSVVLGLIFGLLRVSRFYPARQLASFYIEIVRGIPMLVILYYIAFVGAPELIRFLNWICNPLIELQLLDTFSIRNINFVWRAILALTIGYSAFIAEIFRAGIESIGKGQTEAALALGMSRWQAMRYIVLPQATRNVLPPLGNDFVAMIKDSALVSALGVQDITQIGKVYSSSTFKFFETYNVVACLYLLMTISLSLIVRLLERHLEKMKR